MANIIRKALYVQLPIETICKVKRECKRLDIREWEFIDHAIRQAPKLTRGKGPCSHIIVSGLEKRNRRRLLGHA